MRFRFRYVGVVVLLLACSAFFTTKAAIPPESTPLEKFPMATASLVTVVEDYDLRGDALAAMKAQAQDVLVLIAEISGKVSARDLQDAEALAYAILNFQGTTMEVENILFFVEKIKEYNAYSI